MAKPLGIKPKLEKEIENKSKIEKEDLSVSKSKLVYNEEKKDKSNPYFRDTKISSCSYIKMKGNVAYAIPYYTPKQKSMAEQISKSTYTKSFSKEQYKIKPNMHVAMQKKPLEAYDPNSYRNRLALPDPKFPTTNTHVVEIGDKSMKNPKQYLTSSKLSYGNFGKVDPISHSGILAERTKWHHINQNK